ncbi:MAG: tetratricopeptide repeat protein [Nitrospiria bacterium]
MTTNFISFLLSFFILVSYVLIASGQDMDASFFIKKIDQAYIERDHEDSLKEGEHLCEEALDKGFAKDEILWRKARFKAWDGMMAKEYSGKLNSFKEAEETARKAIEANPGSIEGHFWLGVAYGRIGETQGIFKSFSLIDPIRHEMDEVLKLNPNHPGAHHLLGVMYLKLPWFKGGSNTKSLEELQKSIDLSHNNTLYHLDLAKTYLAMNHSAEAFKELEQVRAITHPFDPVQAGFDKIDAERLERQIQKEH